MSVHRFAVAALAALAAGFLLHSASVRAAGAGPAPVDATPAQRKALGVALVAPVRAGTVSRTWPATVVALPSEAQWVATPVAGLLASVLVEANQRVAAGQPVATVRSSEVAELAAEWLQARSQWSLAEREAARQRALLAEGVIAAARVRQAESAAEQARARLDALRARLQLLGLRESELAASKPGTPLPTVLALRAPAGGVVAEIPVAAGRRIESGTAVARIVRTDRLALEISLPAAEAARLRPGSPVLDAAGRRIAVLGAAPGVVSPAQSASVLARLDAAPGLPWLLGQSVEVALETGAQGWRLPRNAVFRAGGSRWVFVERAGRLVPVAVEMLPGDGREAVVIGALAAGERVATGNVAALAGAAQGIGAAAGDEAQERDGGRP